MLDASVSPSRGERKASARWHPIKEGRLRPTAVLALALVLGQEISLAGPLPAVAQASKPAPEEKTEVVTVRSKPPPRSASDWEVSPDTIQSIPHESGADVLGTLPGVYVSNRGLLGQAPTL